MWIMQELKDYVKHNGHNVEPIHRFISGSGGTGKPHLVKVIYHPVTKTFLYHCKDPEKKNRVLLLGTTRISAVEPPFILVLELNLDQICLVQKTNLKLL